jgi:uncharacterized protein (DUF2252 family)
MSKSGKSTAPSERQKVLENRRRLKMACSAHAYVRGNTTQFYKWLNSDSSAKLPKGPPIWICGDCHVGNLGPVGGSNGKVEIEIRDLDQTVIGNPAHDLVRLGLSLATAARGSDLPGVTTALMLEQIVAGYQAAMNSGETKITISDKASDLEPVQTVLKQATKREWRHLAKDRIKDAKPTIPLGKCFWALSGEEKQEIQRLFEEKETRELVTCLKDRDNDDQIFVLDAAYWMKGCSSLGRLRYAIVLGVGSTKHQEYCLLDVKEAVRAAAPADKKAQMPRDYAQRVVTGARKLSPFLGERMLPGKFLSKPVVIRELMPQDLKLEIDRLTREEAVAAATYLARVVGRAHARQMSVATRKQWSKTLGQHQSKKLNAPNWLWQSVVELISDHEAGYLEHCRQYALE